MQIPKLERFEFTHPGDWISGSDRAQAFETQGLLSLIETEFACAVASCLMFEPITIHNVEQFVTRSKYDRSLNIVYARAFVFSLDSISKILKVLRKQNDATAIREPISRYNDLFGHLKHIRDSVAHMEDRARAVDKDQKSIPSTVIVLGAIRETSIDCTGANGKSYSVDVSETTLISAHEILQTIINAFAWE
jgi:hypothetical protein